MTLQAPSPHPPSTSCKSCSPQKSHMDHTPHRDASNTASNKMRVSFSFEFTGGSLSWPSMPSLGSGLQWKYVFSLYRFATLSLILGLSIALIPLSIAQRNHNSGLGWYNPRYHPAWHSGHHRGRYNYVCGLSVTSLLFTFVAVIADFIRFPSSAPLWLELGLAVAFSIMWLVCAILSVALHDANCILAFIVFGLVMAYASALAGRATWLSWQGADLWTQAVHVQLSKGNVIKLEGDESDLLRASGGSHRTVLTGTAPAPESTHHAEE